MAAKQEVMHTSHIRSSSLCRCSSHKGATWMKPEDVVGRPSAADDKSSILDARTSLPLRTERG